MSGGYVCNYTNREEFTRNAAADRPPAATLRAKNTTRWCQRKNLFLHMLRRLSRLTFPVRRKFSTHANAAPETWATIAEVSPLSPSTSALELELESSLTFEPGQWVDLYIPAIDQAPRAMAKLVARPTRSSRAHGSGRRLLHHLAPGGAAAAEPCGQGVGAPAGGLVHSRREGGGPRRAAGRRQLCTARHARSSLRGWRRRDQPPLQHAASPLRPGSAAPRRTAVHGAAARRASLHSAALAPGAAPSGPYTLQEKASRASRGLDPLPL